MQPRLLPTKRLWAYLRWGAVLLLFVLAFHGRAQADEHDQLSELWIDLSMGPPLVDLFNQRARPDDIARVEHISQLGLLDEVKAGQKLVVFKSADDALRLLPHVNRDMDIVGYNLEHGPANPLDEQENPVESIRRLREATDQYGLKLALGPDRQFAISDAAAMAPYADYLILQVQKVQTEPQTVYDFVRPIIADVRRANPDIQISLQVRTEGDIDALLTMLGPLREEIDGISILTSEETIPVAERLVGLLRPVALNPEPTAVPADRVQVEREPAQSAVATAAPPPQQALDAAARPPAVEARGGGDPEPPLNSTPQANQRAGSTILFVVVALIVGFAVGAGYVSHRAGS